MNIEKLKPWNWFKHEESSTNQIPVSKSEASSDVSQGTTTITSPQQSAVGSLLQLHQEMDRLFDDVWHSFGIPGTSRLTRPNSLFGQSLVGGHSLDTIRAKLDVSGSEKEYEISVELPGLSEDDIQIELNTNTLVVKGQKQEEKETKGKQYYRVERNVGTFQRTLSLPDDADKEAISANMKNGLLIIKIPRKALPQDEVKRISISS